MKTVYLVILTIFLVLIVSTSTAFALSSVSIDKAPYPPSPLMQFKSGMGAKDVKCILGFELILKTENNSPACVELETAQQFVGRGWAKEIIPNVLNSITIVTIPVNSSLSTSGLTFSPSTVKVIIGVNNTVEWINMDGVMNDITSDTGSFKTTLISHGHAWEHLFDKTGTYQYHSAIHPWLKGTVIVVENIQTSSALKLNLSTNSTVVNQGHVIGIKVWLNNTSPSTFVANSQDGWQLKGLGLHPCARGFPFGVGLYEGNYSLVNITSARQLSIYQNGVYNCPISQYSTVNTYVFQPLSDNALLLTPNGNFSSEMMYGINLDGFYVDNVLELLTAGEYTVVGGDEWGHVVAQHFLVVNSTVVKNENKNSITNNDTKPAKLVVYDKGGTKQTDCDSSYQPCRFVETEYFSGNVGHLKQGTSVQIKISDPYDLLTRQYEIAPDNIATNGSFNFTHIFKGRYGQDVYTLDFTYGSQKYELTHTPVFPTIER